MTKKQVWITSWIIASAAAIVIRTQITNIFTTSLVAVTLAPTIYFIIKDMRRK